MTAPYVALAVVVGLVLAVILVAIICRRLKTMSKPTPVPDDARTWRTLRACDAVDEALGEWARLELDAGDLNVAHNIAVARGMVGTLREMTAGL